MSEETTRRLGDIDPNNPETWPVQLRRLCIGGAEDDCRTVAGMIAATETLASNERAALESKLSAAEEREAEAGREREMARRHWHRWQREAREAIDLYTAEREARRKAEAERDEANKQADQMWQQLLPTQSALRLEAQARKQAEADLAAVREALKAIADRGCHNPNPIGGGCHYVTRDMATDAGEPGMEGMAIEEEPDWEPCGSCDPCVAGQALSAPHPGKSLLEELERLRQLASETDAKWDEKAEVWTLPFYRSYEGYTVAAHIPVGDWKHRRQLAAFELEQLRNVAKSAAVIDHKHSLGSCHALNEEVQQLHADLKALSALDAKEAPRDA